VRHARFWEAFYRRFEEALVAASPLLQRVGYRRLEPAFAAAERQVKGLLFDCRMCGQCVLSQTGMSCPMNCPKQMRNGPCGGVRANGHCEVKPEMRCVWVQAWEGSRRMQEGDAITQLQPPVDHRGRERSSWLRVVRERLGEPM
jgi:Methylene-tetrahydrofolate reductase C terminal